MGMTLAERLKKEGYEQGIRQGIRQGVQQGIRQGIRQGVQQGIRQGVRQGIREGMLEAIELGLTIRFGKKGLKMMPRIRKIQSLERLTALKDAIKTAATAEDFGNVLDR